MFFGCTYTAKNYLLNLLVNYHDDIYNLIKYEFEIIVTVLLVLYVTMIILKNENSVFLIHCSQKVDIFRPFEKEVVTFKALLFGFCTEFLF